MVETSTLHIPTYDGNLSSTYLSITTIPNITHQSMIKLSIAFMYLLMVAIHNFHVPIHGSNFTISTYLLITAIHNLWPVRILLFKQLNLPKFHLYADQAKIWFNNIFHTKYVQKTHISWNSKSSTCDAVICKETEMTNQCRHIGILPNYLLSRLLCDRNSYLYQKKSPINANRGSFKVPYLTQYQKEITSTLMPTS